MTIIMFIKNPIIISPDDFVRLLDPNTFEVWLNSVTEDPLHAPFPKNKQKLLRFNVLELNV